MKKKIKVPNCKTCGSKKYMIHRLYHLDIEENPKKWLCIKCSQKKQKKSKLEISIEQIQEIQHLEGKIPYFQYDENILKLNRETRRYNIIEKSDTSMGNKLLYNLKINKDLLKRIPEGCINCLYYCSCVIKFSKNSKKIKKELQCFRKDPGESFEKK